MNLTILIFPLLILMFILGMLVFEIICEKRAIVRGHHTFALKNEKRSTNIARAYYGGTSSSSAQNETTYRPREAGYSEQGYRGSVYRKILPNQG